MMTIRTRPFVLAIMVAAIFYILTNMCSRLTDLFTVASLNPRDFVDPLNPTPLEIAEAMPLISIIIFVVAAILNLLSGAAAGIIYVAQLAKQQEPSIIEGFIAGAVAGLLARVTYGFCGWMVNQLFSPFYFQDILFLIFNAFNEVMDWGTVGLIGWLILWSASGGMIGGLAGLIATFYYKRRTRLAAQAYQQLKHASVS